MQSKSLNRYALPFSKKKKKTGTLYSLEIEDSNKQKIPFTYLKFKLYNSLRKKKLFLLGDSCFDIKMKSLKEREPTNSATCTTNFTILMCS